MEKGRALEKGGALEGDEAAWDAFRDSFGSLYDLMQDSYINAVPPVPTGIGGLDALLGGGMRPGLHTLGGEPGAGKSALALNLAVSAALVGKRVLYASLEMRRAECVARLCSMLSTSGAREPFRWCDWERLGMAARARRDEAVRAGDAKGFVADLMSSDPAGSALSLLMRSCPGLAVADGRELRDLDGLLKAAGRGCDAGLSLLIVDYMQLIDVHGAASEYERVSSVCRALAAFGVDHGVPVLALTSLNRDALRGGEPSKHGGRGSGNSEYDATSMWVLTKDGGEGGPVGGPRPIRLHVVKARSGAEAVGESALPLTFDGAHCLFTLPTTGAANSANGVQTPAAPALSGIGVSPGRAPFPVPPARPAHDKD